MRFANLEREVAIAFANSERANDLAADSINYRLEGMNEFRKQLEDQASHFITRHDLEQMDARMQRVENLLANLQGRLWAIPASVGIISIVVSIFLHYVK